MPKSKRKSARKLPVSKRYAGLCSTLAHIIKQWEAGIEKHEEREKFYGEMKNYACAFAHQGQVACAQLDLRQLKDALKQWS